FSLYSGRVCLPGFACIPLGRPLERLDGARLVEMHHSVELIRQSGLEVMAPALGFGPVDDADGALQSRLAQVEHGLIPRSEVQQEARQTHVVKQRFITTGEPWTDAFALRGTTPIGRSRDGSFVSRETDQNAI